MSLETWAWGSHWHAQLALVANITPYDISPTWKRASYLHVPKRHAYELVTEIWPETRTCHRVSFLSIGTDLPNFMIVIIAFNHRQTPGGTRLQGPLSPIARGRHYVTKFIAFRMNGNRSSSDIYFCNKPACCAQSVRYITVQSIVAVQYSAVQYSAVQGVEVSTYITHSTYHFSAVQCSLTSNLFHYVLG
jgi:hypothetical protein